MGEIKTLAAKLKGILFPIDNSKPKTNELYSMLYLLSFE